MLKTSTRQQHYKGLKDFTQCTIIKKPTSDVQVDLLPNVLYMGNNTTTDPLTLHPFGNTSIKPQADTVTTTYFGEYVNFN